MKKTILLLAMAFASVPALAGDYGHAAASGWFDAENCAFCKMMAAEPGLMANCRWETLPTADGMMNVMSVEPTFAPALAKAEAAQEQLAGRLQRGEVNAADLHLCGYCRAYLELMTAGARAETIKGMSIDVTLVHATDAKLIDKMHVIAKRNGEEMAGMMASRHVAGAHKH